MQGGVEVNSGVSRGMVVQTLINGRSFTTLQANHGADNATFNGLPVDWNEQAKFRANWLMTTQHPSARPPNETIMIDVLENTFLFTNAQATVGAAAVTYP